MSGLELTAALVGSLAWPVVVLAVAVLFRHQLAGLLARPFASLKAGPVEVVWDREIAEVEAELGQPGLPGTPPGGEAGPSEELAEVARLAPAAAVIKAFARVEAQLRQLLRDADLDPSRGSAIQLARRAYEAGFIQPETVKAIEGIAVLRNLAAHGHDVGLDESRALDYLTLTDAVSYALTQEGHRGRRGGAGPRPSGQDK